MSRTPPPPPPVLPEGVPRKASSPKRDLIGPPLHARGSGHKHPKSVRTLLPHSRPPGMGPRARGHPEPPHDDLHGRLPHPHRPDHPAGPPPDGHEVVVPAAPLGRDTEGLGTLPMRLTEAESAHRHRDLSWRVFLPFFPMFPHPPQTLPHTGSGPSFVLNRQRCFPPCAAFGELRSMRLQFLSELPPPPPRVVPDPRGGGRTPTPTPWPASTSPAPGPRPPPLPFPRSPLPPLPSMH